MQVFSLKKVHKDSVYFLCNMSVWYNGVGGDKMSKAITRQAESELPEFGSYDEAKEYFAEKYGVDFILEDIELIGGQHCYFHAIILDWEKYQKGRIEMMRSGSVSGLDYISSYQPIQIMQDGSVHIVH